MTTAELIEADERRLMRDSYRECGGSRRRPLKSFMTDAEKKAARQDHAARIHLATDELADAVGFERWAEALLLNPQLSAMNGALVALQTPAEIVGTAASWKKQGYKVRKGEHAAGRITAPGFWPLAYFTAEQVNAGDLDGALDALSLPDAGALESWRAELAARLAGGEKPRLALDAVAELIRS